MPCRQIILFVFLFVWPRKPHFNSLRDIWLLSHPLAQLGGNKSFGLPQPRHPSLYLFQNREAVVTRVMVSVQSTPQPRDCKRITLNICLLSSHKTLYQYERADWWLGKQNMHDKYCMFTKIQQIGLHPKQNSVKSFVCPQWMQKCYTMQNSQLECI